MSNIIYSKVKFVRNLKGVKFETNISELEQKEVAKLCLEATNSCGLKGSLVAEMNDKVIDNLLMNDLIESEFVDDCVNNVFSNDGNVSVQINSKNHLEIISKDNDVFTAYQHGKILDKQLCNKLNFAYSDKYGFLTPDIKNIGSGMAVEIAIILPALAKMEAIKSLPKINEKLIFEIDCINFQSGLCIIKTTTTLGYNEKQICELAYSYVDKIIKLEIEASKTLAKDIDEIKDKSERAKAILNHCVKISSDEAYLLLGEILISINAGIEQDINIEKINKLFNCIKLNKNNHKELAIKIQQILKI